MVTAAALYCLEFAILAVAIRSPHTLYFNHMQSVYLAANCNLRAIKCYSPFIPLLIKQITEVRDFAGKDIEVKKLVDADSKEAAEKAQSAGVAPTALDAVLEQIKKKQKLTVLDKTKKDWGEFKEDNKGMDEELDAYKKSSNQYLDKVSFLQRTDLREFERERDARLASQSKRRTDTREDNF